MITARVSDQASLGRGLCAIALSAHTAPLNRELLEPAAAQLMGFALLRAQERCGYERVHRPQPMKGLRDVTGGGTRGELH